MSRHRVVALVYDGLCTFEFGCVVEVFALKRPELKRDWYDFQVCAIEPGPLRAMGGLTFKPAHGLRALDFADTIVVPGWRDVDEAPPEALLRRLRAAWRRGARICTICSGVFVPAAAGLLDGKRATTHWRYADRLRERYPAITVEPNALYVDAGRLITSAGSAAGLDMLLHVVRRDHGARVANVVAQRLVLAPHREGGQAQFVPRPVPTEVGTLAPLMQSIRGALNERHTLASMAKRGAISVRTLQRRFLESAGVAPLQWLIRERVTWAKELLERDRRSMSEVATAVGFASDESFRRHFRRVAGVSPAAYRRHFFPR
jgi:AraC family transcriptional regulator, transcriptional activator FtrA